MKFEQFAKVIEDLRATNELVDTCSKYLKPALFEKHNTLIADLLEGMYYPDAISYILYEWLVGNRSPLEQTLPDGTKVVHELQTIYDLWKVMELYRVDSDSMPSELKEQEVVDSEQ